MEDTLRVKIAGFLGAHTEVLILVLMEDTLRVMLIVVNHISSLS